MGHPNIWLTYQIVTGLAHHWVYIRECVSPYTLAKAWLVGSRCTSSKVGGSKGLKRFFVYIRDNDICCRWICLFHYYSCFLIVVFYFSLLSFIFVICFCLFMLVSFGFYFCILFTFVLWLCVFYVLFLKLSLCFCLWCF